MKQHHAFLQRTLLCFPDVSKVFVIPNFPSLAFAEALGYSHQIAGSTGRLSHLPQKAHIREFYQMTDHNTLHIAEFAAKLNADHSEPSVAYVFDDDPAQTVPLQVSKKPNRPLSECAFIFAFHGAVDRTSEPPFFYTPLTEDKAADKRLIISVADPLLSYSDDIYTAFYAGAEDFDLPTLLSRLVSQIVKAINPRRTVFVGGSTGGHAALVQSWLCSESIAVVRNPILNISNYPKRLVAPYRTRCWPNLRPSDALPERASANVADRYKGGFENTVILLQNARDHHFWAQSAGFIGSIADLVSRDKFLFVSSFFKDHTGHRYPLQEFLPWIMAAIDSTNLSADKIGLRASKYSAGNRPIRSKQRTTDEIPFEGSDIEIQNKLEHLYTVAE